MATTSKWLDAIMTHEGTPKLLPIEFAYMKAFVSSYHIYKNKETSQYAIYIKYNEHSLPEEEWISGNSTELLRAMLNLWKDIGEELFLSLRENSYLFVGLKREEATKQEEERKSLLDDRIFQRIIAFCNKHGYPFSLNEQTTTRKSFLKLTNLSLDRHEGFFVTDFLRELDDIYGSYCLVQRILGTGTQTPIDKKAKISVPILSPNSTYLRPLFSKSEESEIIAAYKQFGGDEMSIEDLSDRIHNCCITETKERVSVSFKTIEDIEKDVAKHNKKDEQKQGRESPQRKEKELLLVEDVCGELFLQKFKQRRYENQVIFDNGLYLGIRSKNLFDAAFYELAQMLILPKRNVKLCPICRTYFIPQNGHQKYCDTKKNGKKTCYPEKMYKRKNYKPRNKTETADE